MAKKRKPDDLKLSAQLLLDFVWGLNMESQLKQTEALCLKRDWVMEQTKLLMTHARRLKRHVQGVKRG